MSTSETTNPVGTKARRGDLAVIVSRSRIAVVGGEGYESVRIVLGRVSSVTRAGLVKRYEEPRYVGADDRDVAVQSRDQVLLVGADVVDVEAVLVQYRKRAKEGEGMIRPLTSMGEARDLIRPWRYSQQ